MSRFLLLFCTLVALGAAPFSGFAAEPALTQEVHELRRDLQLQGKKLDALTQQIAELSRIIQARDSINELLNFWLPNSRFHLRRI